MRANKTPAKKNIAAPVRLAKDRMRVVLIGTPWG
jgi:hypothetical protein